MYLALYMRIRLTRKLLTGQPLRHLFEGVSSLLSLAIQLV